MLSNPPPDTTGAVSPNYAMSVSNDAIVIQDRCGNVLKSTNLNSFWTAAFGTAISPAWDPNVRYDPYADRWILVDMGAYGFYRLLHADRSQRHQRPDGHLVSAPRTQERRHTTFDHPRVGFNKNWIVVTGNELRTATTTQLDLFGGVRVSTSRTCTPTAAKLPHEFSNITTDFTVDTLRSPTTIR